MVLASLLVTVASVHFSTPAGASPPTLQWSAGSSIDTGNNFTSVSCPTPSFCAAVDNAGNVLTYNGTTWTAPTDIDASFAFGTVSCLSAVFCMAVGGPNAISFNGVSWSSTDIDPGLALNSVSCSSSSFCAAVDGNSHVFTYTNGVWSPPTTVNAPPPGGLSSVSCPSSRFCIAIDVRGSAFTYKNGTWNTNPVTIDGNAYLYSVSCPSTASCAVSADGGSVVTLSIVNGDIDTHDIVVDDIDGSGDVDSVSCSSASFCVAMDSFGGAYTGSGDTWSTSGDLNSQGPFVSCVSASLCVAVSESDAFFGTSPPSVTGVNPPVGDSTTGSTAVTVYGSGFLEASTVSFGSVLGTDVDIVSDTVLNVDSPVPPAACTSSPSPSTCTVDVTVTNANGATSMIDAADTFTYDVTVTSDTECPGGGAPCTSSAGNPDPVTVSAQGTPLAASAIDLSVETGTLSCGASYDYPTAVSTLSTMGFSSNEVLTVTETVGGVPSTTGVGVCFEGEGSMTANLLTQCAQGDPTPPCLESIVESSPSGSVTATFLSPSTDPRFWTGEPTAVLKKFTPTRGAPGKRVTIKGKDLSGVVSVTIGGATVPSIEAETSTKLVVTVPTDAQATGPIGLTGTFGDIDSTSLFTVT
jgi:hypothetical protein